MRGTLFPTPTNHASPTRSAVGHHGNVGRVALFLLLLKTSWCVFFFAHFYFPASGQSRCHRSRPFSPPRLLQSSSICAHKKKTPRIYTKVCTRGPGLELAKLEPIPGSRIKPDTSPGRPDVERLKWPHPRKTSGAAHL